MSVTPAKHTLTIWKGGTFAKQMVIKNADSGLPEDLTGFTAEVVVRDSPGGVVLLTLATEGTGITIGGPAGTINIFLTDEETDAITWLGGSFALYLTDAAGNTDIIMRGPVRVRTV